MKAAIMGVIAAAAMTSPIGQSAAASPRVTDAHSVWTLRFRENGRTVRTVTFKHVAVRLGADVVAEWRHKPGGFYFWEVVFQGRNVAESLRLCADICADAEPGHGSFGYRFNNLSETTTAVTGGRNTITLSGSLTFDGNGSIGLVSADRWFSAHDSSGDAFATPESIAAVSGEQLVFTVVIGIAPRPS